jgi:hypothetical protein
VSERQYANTLSFWRSVEALSPQEVPKLKKDDRKKPGKDLGQADIALWHDDDVLRIPLDKGKEWSFTVFGGLISRKVQVQALAQVLGTVDNVFDDRLNGVSCMFSLRLNATGRPSAESFVLSMSTWATGVVLRSGLESLGAGDAFDSTGLRQPQTPIKHPPGSSGFTGFDLQAKSLRDELAWRVSVLQVGEGVTMQWLHDFADLVATKCGVLNLFPQEEEPLNRVTGIQLPIRKPEESSAKQEDELINSFFIRDINRALKSGVNGASAPLRSFLQGEPEDRSHRLDVCRDRPKVLSLLEPKRFPVGCWPAEHPLVWSQQLAINAAWSDLRNAEGLFAVNGPPGTGKTTLLRDFVAAIVVDRAQQLKALGAAAFQGKEQISIGSWTQDYYPLAPGLAGYSIVVASSNNGAVENLSLELPLEKAIDPRWLPTTDFYKALAGHILEAPAWGLLAGKLGNSGNRQAFSNKLYWSKEETSGISGMQELLDRCSQPGFKPRYTFNQAKENFQKALDAEAELRSTLQEFHELPEQVRVLTGQLSALEQLATAAANNAAAQQGIYNDALANEAAASKTLGESSAELDRLNARKPGFFEGPVSYFRRMKEWRAESDELTEIHRGNKSRRDAAATDMNAAAAALKQKTKQATDAAAAEVELARQAKAAGDKLKTLSSKYMAYLPDLSLPDDQVEKSSPWSVPEWREARIQVFLRALDLHRAFVESNAAKMRDNLGLVANMLSKGLPSGKARVTAYDSLALVCPVISTAFASVASMFGEIDSPAIGWLLIDEAGQAPPQACVGALWRSKRAVVVGDPLQLEPVVTIPHSVEASLAALHGRVSRDLHPTQTSAQRLADHRMALGTTIGATAKDAVWVGAPLRVHRRCDDPMFTISNLVAYGGMMVHQKAPSVSGLPPSRWINVPAGQPPSGHWLPAEGVALEALLNSLRHHPQGASVDIFLVSPFSDVVAELKHYGRRFGIDPAMVGTVHTTQGKEAQAVILVLGGGTAGARNWAAESANLLNVAVSRAKSRLYVIGDKTDWGSRRFFDVAARRL